MKFHNLTVISFIEKRGRKPYWLCKCDCGNEKIICEFNFTSGATHSCGCKRSKQLAIQNKANIKHGLRNTRIYRIWCCMKYRCDNNESDGFKYYGERGVQVCKTWSDNFYEFYDWSIHNGYNDDLTIDRIDVNGIYEPCNCRWTTMKVQENNKRNNLILNHNGRSQTATLWSEEIGINRSTLYKRLRSGWSVSDALSRPVNKNKLNS